MDRWDDGYVRALWVNGRVLLVRVTQHGGPDAPTLRASVDDEQYNLSRVDRQVVRSQLTSLLGLDVDLTAFYELADSHPHTAELKDRFLGLRPPQFPTTFEALVNAVANQQLSLEVGIELLNRLTEAFGQEADAGLRAFPTPQSLAAVSPQDLRNLGFSRAKANYLIGIAECVLSGHPDPDELRSGTRAEVEAALTGLNGIGRWSAEYVMLRGLGRLEVFPGDDVGARNKLQRFLRLTQPPSYDEIARRLDPWQPYAGMLYFHLLLDGLVEGGSLPPM